MLKNFLNQPNVIGRLMIALLFVGGVVYAGAFDGFIVETEASCCCGGETDAALFSSSECCDQDCPCAAVDCDVSNCSNCTVKTCPKGCLEPGETCACSARCGKDPCKAECLPNPLY
ncbi:hypothetical protein F4054_11535 [Candidatus Poribacteria bacterium]|nr:hypothetical protein [Candidatus Poribacteria bacterium]